MTQATARRHEPCDAASQDRTLPLPALLAFATTGFIAILTETLPAGLLPQIASSLQVSTSWAGQLVTLYAMGSLLAAIPLTMATRHWPRRRTLQVAVAGFLVFNTVTALSPYYVPTLVARFLAGVAAGLAWGLIAGYARRLVPPSLQGRALAIAMVGTPVALSIGVPVGTWMGLWLGWRWIFALMSLLALILMGWIRLAVPDVPGPGGERPPSLGTVTRTPGVPAVLSVIFGWMLAHNILYTYIAPCLTASGHAGMLGSTLLIFGLTAFVGIAVTGAFVDQRMRQGVLGSLLIFAIGCAAMGTPSRALLLGGVALWGFSFGGAATLLQTAAADAAGADATDIAQAMVTTAWNLAIAGGGLAGGVLLHLLSASWLPWVVLIPILLAGLIAALAYRHGFRPGARHPLPSTACTEC